MESITSPPMAQSSTGSFFSPLLISMLGIVVTSIAIIAYHLFLVKYCIRRHGSTNTAAQPTTTAQPATGVDEKVLKTIPIFAFSVVKRDMDQEECVVCLGELEDEDMVRLLPNCKHAFHVPCIDQWFAAHTSCPLCRSAILEQTNVVPCLDPHRTNDSDRESSESSATSSSRESSSPREQSFGLLRHCASLVLPPPMERRSSSSQLKRSLSMDQSFVVINLQRVNCSSASSSSSSRGVLTRSGSYSTRSLSHFDRVSSKWLRSFSRLRVGKGSNGTILPY
ncbi:hypothetical protein Pfo_028700 [Paulownia fortunei]|nr:hypothetical protein Pfo_028700 [Paulownia fortunei]